MFKLACVLLLAATAVATGGFTTSWSRDMPSAFAPKDQYMAAVPLQANHSDSAAAMCLAVIANNSFLSVIDTCNNGVTVAGPVNLTKKFWFSYDNDVSVRVGESNHGRDAKTGTPGRAVAVVHISRSLLGFDITDNLRHLWTIGTTSGPIVYHLIGSPANGLLGVMFSPTTKAETYDLYTGNLVNSVTFPITYLPEGPVTYVATAFDGDRFFAYSAFESRQVHTPCDVVAFDATTGAVKWNISVSLTPGPNDVVSTVTAVAPWSQIVDGEAQREAIAHDRMPIYLVAQSSARYMTTNNTKTTVVRVVRSTGKLVPEDTLHLSGQIYQMSFDFGATGDSCARLGPSQSLPPPVIRHVIIGQQQRSGVMVKSGSLVALDYWSQEVLWNSTQVPHGGGMFSSNFAVYNGTILLPYRTTPVSGWPRYGTAAYRVSGDGAVAWTQLREKQEAQYSMTASAVVVLRCPLGRGRDTGAAVIVGDWNRRENTEHLHALTINESD